MIYYVMEPDGTVYAIATRLQDAEAMCHRIKGDTKKYIKKVDTHASDVNISA